MKRILLIARREYAAYAGPCFGKNDSLLGGVTRLMGRIFDEFTFDDEATQVATPLLQVLEERRGVCQDFAHLMLACLRSRGLKVF